MCDACYERYGSPKIVNEATKAMAKRIEEFFDIPGCSVGGPFHIVFDDWNLDARSIQWCLRELEKPDLAIAMGYDFELKNSFKKLGEDFLAMSLRQRASALAIYDGYLTWSI